MRTDDSPNLRPDQIALQPAPHVLAALGPVWLLALQAFKAVLAICAWACQPEINKD
jgi:hypothetical protein